MNEKKTMKRPLKALRVLAMAAMLTLALAVTANAASGGELLEGVFQTIVVTFTSPNGDGTFAVEVNTDAGGGTFEGLVSPEHGAAVTENRDGRLFLIIGDVETDITDALNENGEYTTVLDGKETVTVSGTVEDHMILTSAEDSDVYYITTKGDTNALNGASVDLSEGGEAAVSYAPMEAADSQTD